MSVFQPVLIDPAENHYQPAIVTPADDADLDQNPELRSERR